MIKYEYADMKKFDTRHGGAFDRGSADSYYGRACVPHMFEGATNQSRLIEQSEMSAEQIADYKAGFQWNEQCGDKKDWS